MNIKHPELLFLLLLLPVVLWLLNYSYRRTKKALALLADPSKLKILFPDISQTRTWIKKFLIFIAFLMFVLALISPRWGYEWVEVETKGTNIIIALDVSRSMLATDIQPNRLTRAKFELSKLIDMLRGDRLGLIVFAGDAFLQAPLTNDYSMVKDWLSSIDTNSMSSQGTSIKSALEVADKAFSYIKSESKALIIISDGEEQDKETLDMARQLKSAGVNIYTIAVGTNEGSPIELPEGGLLKDKNGQIVISKLDDKFLKEIAEIGGGSSVRSTNGDFHLQQLYYDQIKKKLGNEVVKSGKTKQWYETYQVFMAIGFGALFLELILSFSFGRLIRFFRKKETNLFEVGSKVVNR